MAGLPWFFDFFLLFIGAMETLINNNQKKYNKQKQNEKLDRDSWRWKEGDLHQG